MFLSWNGNDWAYPAIPGKKVIVKRNSTERVLFEPIGWTSGRNSWWWPNVPYREKYMARLHVLRLSLREVNLIHTCDTRFGFREIRQVGRYYELNGIRVNFRGDHLQVANYDRIDNGGRGDAIDTLPGFLPPSDSNPGWPKAVDNFLRLNLNVQRQHMGPWTPYMLDVCDEMGLMLIGESASRLEGFDRVNGRAPHEVKCLRDIVLRDRNHPSIIRWSVSNEPQCDDPGYHLELYETVMAVDGTRPISEDIWSIDYLKEPLDVVFSSLLDKDNFTWIEHYLSSDESGCAVHDCSHYNDGMIPLLDRPFGIGEANLHCVSSPRGLTCFATTIALLRARDASDVRPYVLLSCWASSIPGVRISDFIGEDGRHPEYGEDNLPSPWNNPKLQLIQKACHPVFAFDYHYWLMNKESNAAGTFPVQTPVFALNTEVIREIVVFNDVLNDDGIGSKAELHWNIRLGSSSNIVYQQGWTELDVAPGHNAKTYISFTTPGVGNVMVLSLEVRKDGVLLFNDDTTVYEAVDEKTCSMQEFLQKTSNT